MHWQLVPRTEASALGPQGFGLQGSLGGGGAGEDRDQTFVLLDVSLSREMDYTLLQIFVFSQNAIQNCWCKMQSRQTIIQN